MTARTLPALPAPAPCPEPPGVRLAWGCMAAVSAALGLALALHHPVAPIAVTIAFCAWTALLAWRPRAWLVALPAALPLANFAPWTGWLTFEEWDLLALGVAAGGYAALALAALRSPPPAPAPAAKAAAGRAARIARIALAVFVASAAVAFCRGIVDAGPLELGWSQGYYETLNSVRVAKSLVLALLLAPLLRREMRAAPLRTAAWLATGIAAGGALAALAVLWERAAFPGVLDFSTDYRATGLFWEMHVGGAALDGFLALSLPFVVWAALRARRPIVLAGAVGLLGLTLYACLATFSRGVYLAVPVSFMVLAVASPVRRDAGLRAGWPVAGKGVAAGAATAFACHAVFQSGGYRALAAALGALAIALLLSGAPRRAGRRDWLVALAVGLPLGAALAAAGWRVPKGPYVVYAAAWAAAAALAWRQRIVPGRRWPVTLAAFVAALVAALAVALHWGGHAAVPGSAAALAAILALAVFATASARPPLAPGGRAEVALFGAAVVIAGTIAVFSGGAYMADRFSAGGTDLTGRIKHWRDGVRMLDGPADWLLGKGLGRFPANYFLAVRDSMFPGSYQLQERQGDAFMTLSGPRLFTSFGDLLRVSQRLQAPAGAYVATLEVRAPLPAILHVEMCEKHLLYNASGCALAAVAVKGSGEQWQRIAVSLDGRRLGQGPAHAPRLAFFSIAVQTIGTVVDVHQVGVVDSNGAELLVNGDFARGMACWYFTSDRHHLPWHIKSLPLNWLFDQGLLGLASALVLVGAVLARLLIGRVATHPAARYIAAALAGFLVVGGFDSLTDVPRVAFLFYLLVAAGLMLDPDPESSDTRW